MRRPTVVLVFAASCMVGCAGEDAPEGWTVAADTVESTLRVINTPPAADPGPTLIAEEELRVGTMDGGGPATFGLLRSVAVLDDGRFAVGDGQAQEVRLFDAAGTHLRTFGGEGQGPGELAGMQGVYVDHEGMLRVAEQANGRLSVFHPDSGFVGSFPLRLFSYSGRGPWRAAVDEEGRTWVVSSGQYGEGRFWNMLRAYDPEMRQLDSIPYNEYTDVPFDEDQPGAWSVSMGNGGFGWAPVPFYAGAQQTLDPTGQLWTSTEGATELEVARWTPGDTALVMVSRRPATPVTAAERDSALAALREQTSRMTDNLPTFDPDQVPATKPPTYGLSLDDQGRLWSRLTDPGADTTVYDVFTHDGRYAETVMMPFQVDGWIPPVVRGEVVWAVVTDELDVQSVVRARLRGTGGVGG